MWPSQGVEMKAIIVQLLHPRLRFLWPHASHDPLCHSCDASEISDMLSRIAVSREVPRICAPAPLPPATSDCVDIIGLSGLPVAMILCALTYWPFGRKLQAGRALRNRCCSGTQLIHVRVADDQRNATPGLQKKNSFTGTLCFLMNAANSRVVLHALPADVQALGTSSSRAT